MIKRICFCLLCLISIFFGPFWLSLILAVLGMFLFAFFWEVVLLFLISDFFGGVKEIRFFNITIVATIVSLVLLALIEFLKKRLKFYEKENK